MDILVLDDEPKSALLAKMLLERLLPGEVRVRLIHSVSELPAAMAGTRPDLLFLDIEVNGRCALDFLDNPDSVGCPLVITTASKSFAYRAFEAGALAYLLKPLGEDDLREALLRLNRIFHWKEKRCRLSV